jgi:hypothetical protein
VDLWRFLNSAVLLRITAGLLGLISSTNWLTPCHGADIL